MNKKTGLKIKHQLEDAGSSFSAVARELEPPVTPQAVQRVAHLVRKTPRIRAAIESKIGPVEWSSVKSEEKEAA